MYNSYVPSFKKRVHKVRISETHKLDVSMFHVTRKSVNEEYDKYLIFYTSGFSNYELLFIYKIDLDDVKEVNNIVESMIVFINCLAGLLYVENEVKELNELVVDEFNYVIDFGNNENNKSVWFNNTFDVAGIMFVERDDLNWISEIGKNGEKYYTLLLVTKEELQMIYNSSVTRVQMIFAYITRTFPSLYYNSFDRQIMNGRRHAMRLLTYDFQKINTYYNLHIKDFVVLGNNLPNTYVIENRTSRELIFSSRKIFLKKIQNIERREKIILKKKNLFIWTKIDSYADRALTFDFNNDNFDVDVPACITRKLKNIKEKDIVIHGCYFAIVLDKKNFNGTDKFKYILNKDGYILIFYVFDIWKKFLQCLFSGNDFQESTIYNYNNIDYKFFIKLRWDYYDINLNDITMK